MSFNKTENTIIWQKWLDPFGEDDDILENFSDKDNISDDFYEEDDEEEKESLNENDSKNNLIKPIKKNIKVIATPMGIVPVTENTCSGKIFNFWLGHTNFDITKKVAAIIECTDGVETLDVFTRYRFRISVGKAFNDSSVMRNINKNVYSYLE